MEGQLGATRRVRMWREGLVLQWGWGYGIQPNPNRRPQQDRPVTSRLSGELAEQAGVARSQLALRDRIPGRGSREDQAARYAAVAPGAGHGPPPSPRS